MTSLPAHPTRLQWSSVLTMSFRLIHCRTARCRCDHLGWDHEQSQCHAGHAGGQVQRPADNESGGATDPETRSRGSCRQDDHRGPVVVEQLSVTGCRGPAGRVESVIDVTRRSGAGVGAAACGGHHDRSDRPAGFRRGRAGSGGPLRSSQHEQPQLPACGRSPREEPPVQLSELVDQARIHGTTAVRARPIIGSSARLNDCVMCVASR